MAASDTWRRLRHGSVYVASITTDTDMLRSHIYPVRNNVTGGQTASGLSNTASELLWHQTLDDGRSSMKPLWTTHSLTLDTRLSHLQYMLLCKYVLTDWQRSTHSDWHAATYNWLVMYSLQNWPAVGQNSIFHPDQWTSLFARPHRDDSADIYTDKQRFHIQMI